MNPMPPNQSSSLILYPVDAEFNAAILTVPVLIFAIPIASITATVWFSWQLAKAGFIAGRMTFKLIKKISSQKTFSPTI